jgi:hypothetical protein
MHTVSPNRCFSLVILFSDRFELDDKNDKSPNQEHEALNSGFLVFVRSADDQLSNNKIVQKVRQKSNQ